MPSTHETFFLDDAQLIDALVQVAAVLGPQGAKLSVTLKEHNKTVSCELAECKGSAELQSILRHHAALLGRVTLSLAQAPYNACSVDIRRNGVTDAVAVSLRNDIPFPSACELQAVVQDKLPPYQRDATIDQLLGTELAEFYRKRERDLQKLEGLAQRIIEQNEEYRRKLDQEADAANRQLQDKHEILTKELQGAYERKDEALHAREQQLETKLREIDDRSSRHARRQIRKDLKEAIAARNTEFSLTPKTARKRRIIHIAFLALIGTLALMLILCLRHPPSASGTLGWFQLARLPLVSAAIAASLIYYIRWNDIWFRRHADEEFLTKRFELDVDRASWLVEMALEWKDEKGTEIPRELLDRLSANLFDRPYESTEVRHPSEDLLSELLRASAQLDVTVPGLGKVRLDRRGTNRFSRAVAKR